MKNTYCRQKYLFEIDSGSTEADENIVSQNFIDNIQDYTVPCNLFDQDDYYIRKIDINYLDSGADTLEEFKKMASFLSDVDELIIVNSREQCEYSNILFDYARTTLKAYIHLFHESGIQNVKVVRVN